MCITQIIDDLICFANNGDVDGVKHCLDNSTDIHPNIINANNSIALVWASENGHQEIVKLLLEHGANVHARDSSSLKWASENGHTNVVKLLINYGCKFGVAFK